MNKDFVPHEESLELKELGFNEPCFAVYSEHDKTRVYEESSIVEGLKIQAPLYQQTFRWFREKHDLLNDVGISANRKNDTKKWMYSIIYLDKNTYIYSEETYNTYEEAELACLKKLIEIVKNKN